jgi:hypothetical protein
MDADTIAAAEKYRKMLDRQKEYYQKNQDLISAKWKEKYHAAHPDAKTRNRRRKGSEEGSSGSSSS